MGGCANLFQRNLDKCPQESILLTKGILEHHLNLADPHFLTMAPHSSTFAWKIPWMEKPGGLQSMGSLRVGHEWTTSLSLCTFKHWRRKWQPTPVFLPGESQRLGSLVGCRLWGCRVGHDWSDIAAAAFPDNLGLSVTVIPQVKMGNFWSLSINLEKVGMILWLDFQSKGHRPTLVWVYQKLSNWV